MKSELNGEYVITKPAIVDAKLRITDAVAGSDAGGLVKCFPPTPRATTNTTSTGSQARRSYQLRTL